VSNSVPKEEKNVLKIPNQQIQRRKKRIPTQSLKKVVKDEVEAIAKFVQF